MGYMLNFDAVWRSLNALIEGLFLGLGLAVAAGIAGSVIGLVLAFLLISPNRLLRRPASIYITIIRNTPLLVLVLITYFALPQVGIRMGKVEGFIATLAFYSGAYLAEVFRAGLLAVPNGLREAGLAIGLSNAQIRGSIVLPLMLRTVLPSLSNQLISLFKETSLAAVISIPELTFQARKINAETFRIIETWLVVSGMYVVTCFGLAALLRVLERRLALAR